MVFSCERWSVQILKIILNGFMGLVHKIRGLNKFEMQFVGQNNLLINYILIWVRHEIFYLETNKIKQARHNENRILIQL